jgi:hypothetical protein
MLGEAVFEREDDPPGVQGYYVEGFSHQTTAWHPSQLYPLLPLVEKMPEAFR